MGIAPLVAVASRVVIGPLIDRWGAKRIMQAGSLFLGIPPLIYYLFLNEGLIPIVWFFRIVQGIGWGAYYSSYFTLAGRLAPTFRRNEALSVYGIGSLSAVMLGPLTGEWLVRYHGFGAFFMAMAGLNAAAFVVLSFVQYRSRNFVEETEKTPVGSILKISGFIFILSLALLFSLSTATPRNFLAPVAYAKGIVPFSPYFMVFAMTGILVRLVGGRLGDRIGQKRLLVPSCIIYAIGLLSIYFSSTIIHLVFAGLLCGMAHGLAFPAMMTLGYSIAPRHHTGKVMAFVTGMMDAGSSLNAFFLGLIALRFGYGSVFLPPIVSACMVSVLLLINTIFFPRKAVKA
jgi:MFS family permease